MERPTRRIERQKSVDIRAKNPVETMNLPQALAYIEMKRQEELDILKKIRQL